MELKGTKTEQNLWTAFAGESQARVKYGYYASAAKKEGYNQIAAFFEETSGNEKERAKIFGQYDHVRIYGRDFFDKLRSVGFQVDEVNYTYSLSNEEIKRYCLASGEIIPVCYK